MLDNLESGKTDVKYFNVEVFENRITNRKQWTVQSRNDNIRTIGLHFLNLTLHDSDGALFQLWSLNVGILLQSCCCLQAC